MNKIVLIGTTADSITGFRSDLIKKMILYGYKVFAFTCEYNDKKLEEISALGAIPVTYKMSRGGLNPFSDIQALLSLKSEIEKINPDLVLSYFTKPVVYGSLASKLCKTPKIIGMIEGLGTPFTEHQNGQSLKVKLIKIFQITLYRIVFPFIDKIIFLNSDDPHDLIYTNKIKHKSNSINILEPIGL
ncbi:glycosyltransferase, partial [Acinetobacter guillouiae]|uniref:glycosyltransferase n=1 Tax=Acinetobacter guillouiae TaxID=106649 RepID=UPI0025B22938